MVSLEVKVIDADAAGRLNPVGAVGAVSSVGQLVS